MKSFVKVNNGTFPNLNFFLAWEAFNTMGYSVTLFEEKDIDTLDITTETPVFAGVTVFRKVLDKLGVNYPPFDCYPEVLKPFYGRTIRRSTLGDVRNEFNKTGIPVFVKPIKPKEFVGVTLKSILNLIPIAHKSDDIPVYVCEPMEIESEFRVYINDKDILGIKHYYGKWNIIPDEGFIKNVIKEYKPSPIAYGIDFGVYKNYDGHEPKLGLYGKGPVNTPFVIEVNDGCNLGNYGLDSIHYGEMIVSRWFEIVSHKYVESEIERVIQNFKGTEHEDYYAQEYFTKKIEGCSRSLKDIMLSEKQKERREKSMFAFAKECQERIGEV